MKSENPVGFDVALLTGGADRPYAYGLALALATYGTRLEVIGNDELDCREVRDHPGLRFLNLRGNQNPNAGVLTKVLRVLRYYARLLGYTTVAQPRMFHILWNNKFEYFDRTVLMMWYFLLGKCIVLTLHNVNSRERDGGDSLLNRLTLHIQYALADHLFVHTDRMKEQLINEFGIDQSRISVIPFGINNAVPISNMSRADARKHLGIDNNEKTLLFFGNIAPYKGLELLTGAFSQVARQGGDYRLVIAGRPKNCDKYWNALRSEISDDVQNGRIILKEEYVPDNETELYFKACDVLVLPYRYIYQSGVLFLGYSFGLPVLAADVGSLKDDIAEGMTGFVFRPEDPEDMARAIERYFASDLYRDLAYKRDEIRAYALERHSWNLVARMTAKIYASLRADARSTARISVDAKLD
jgi:D-inositol-3-phosphate glycosyltransferase